MEKEYINNYKLEATKKVTEAINLALSTSNSEEFKKAIDKL